MQNSKLAIVILGILLVGGVVYFVLRGDSREQVATFTPVETQKIEIGVLAPDVSLTDFSGSTTKLSDYKGKAVVIDFWAAWCPFCVEEMAELEKAYQVNRERLVIIGIHRTDTEGKERGASFAQERGVTYPLITDSDGSLYNTFRKGINAMPLALFIDKEGVVRDIKFGPKTQKEVEEKVSALLE